MSKKVLIKQMNAIKFHQNEKTKSYILDYS